MIAHSPIRISSPTVSVLESTRAPAMKMPLALPRSLTTHQLHDVMRFESPRGLMSYLGVVPSEYSSGEKERRGEITKAGNKHVRRLLIEAAWHYRLRPGVATLAKRRQGQPTRVIAIADRAMHRLHRRFTRMVERGKPRPKVVVAVARELSGFVWAALRKDLA